MGILRIAGLPASAARVWSDRWLWPYWLKLTGVQSGPGLKLSGRPWIKIASGGTIRLGKNVQLVSRRQSNPLQILTPCSFTVRGSGTSIIIGDDSALSGTVICADSGVTIGARVMIGANCTIVDTDFHPLSPRARREHSTRGAATRPIVIGDDVFIGTQVIILKGTTIGNGCVIGAGAVVAGNFPPFSIIAGNPARVIKEIALEERV